MARATRVGKRHLEALEAEDLKELPAPVFVKGFIRAYCDFLRESPEQALTLYRAVQGEPALAPHVTPAARPAAAWLRNPLFLGALLLVLLALGLIAFKAFVRADGGPRTVRGQVPAAQFPAAADSPSVAGAGAPAQAAGRPLAPGVDGPGARPEPARAAEAGPAVPRDPAGPATPAAPSPPVAGSAVRQHLVVRAVEESWIRVRFANGSVVEELLRAGAIREWTSDGRFRLTLGNAGGVEVELNGERLPPFGVRGEVVRDLALPRAVPTSGS
jgi:cytoskeleton protein RodZ